MLASTTMDQGDLSGASMTILSYNVRNCVGLDNVVNYQRVADVIIRSGADIVALQELDSATIRSKGVSVLDELARSTGMIATYRASISFQGGKYGIGILSKEKPLKAEGMALPGKEEMRSVLVVEMKKYVLACTHLSLTEADRIRSVELINELLSKYKKPVFLAGDLNAKPDSKEIQSLSKNWKLLSDTAKFTFPADKPEVCIDYIMLHRKTSRRIRLEESVVGVEPLASDHSPLWVRIRLK